MACRRIGKLAALMVLPLVFASGCWDAVDINDRSIITAVVVDKTDYGYAFYAEMQSIVGGGQGESVSGKPKVVIIQSEGRTLSEAREDLDRRLNKPAFLGAAQAVILTDRLASYTVEEYLLRLRQLAEYRKTVHVVVTSGDPAQFLSGEPENAQTVGFAVDRTIMSLAKTGQLQHIALMDVLEALSSPYPRFILSTFAIIDGQPTFTGYTVFSGGMKTGFIPAADCKGIVFLLAQNPRFEYTIPFQDTHVATQVRLLKKKIVPVYENGNITFHVGLEFKATLLYPEKIKPLTDMDMEKIHRVLLEELKREFTQTLEQSQQAYRCDYLRLHDYFRIAYPEEYKRMNWAEEYDRARFDLTIKAELASLPAIDYGEE